MTEIQKIDFTPIEIPKIRRGYWGLVKIAAALVAIGGAGWAWSAGYRPPFLGRDEAPAFKLIEIGRGDINLIVTEMGTVESSNNRTIRCTVEALLGQVGGSQGTGKTPGGTGGGGGAGGAQGSSGGGASGGASDASQATPTKAKTATKAGGSTAAAGSTATGGATSGTSTASSSTTTSSTTSTSSSTSTTSSTAGKKPVIRSFTYAVPKYVALRPATKPVDPAAQKKAQQQLAQQQGGGGGGRGKGRRKGGGGGMEDEKPGATTIVEIVPEGKRVKKGEVICRLDASAFQDEEQAQKIRHIKALSYVQQANAILEVNQITLREYRDGIYPQDLQLVRQYIKTCTLEKERLERTAIWSRDMGKIGYRTKFQVKGDELAYEQAKIALGEAENMLARLVKQTGPKIRTALEANVEATKADKFTQDAALSLETQRLERLQRNIKNCTLVAPSDGIAVYVNVADWTGRVTTPIDQGVTVRQDQPIINLPDPLHMRSPGADQ